MKHNLKFIFISALSMATAFQMSAATPRQWSQGDPSTEEQYALEVINRYRADPVAAARFYTAQAATDTVLANQLPDIFTRDADNHPVTGASASILLAQQSLDAYRNAHGFVTTKPPKGPLALYPLFTEQAAAQITASFAGTLTGANTIPASLFNTDAAIAALPGKVQLPVYSFVSFADATATPALTGSNATGGSAAIKPGFSDSKSAAAFLRDEQLFVINYYDARISIRNLFLNTSGVVMNMVMDDVFTENAPASGAKTFGKVRMIGVSLSAARTQSPGIGNRLLRVFSTDNEAFSSSDLPYGSSTLFVTGVAYQDTDKSNDYTAGEGLSRVKITLSQNGIATDWFAITTTSGGYSIPVQPNSGAYVVTAQGIDDPTINMSTVVTVAADNVKQDFVPFSFVKPTQIPVAASDGTAQLTNLSTRGVAEAGQTALVGGFVISGTGTKQVLVRGISRTLTNFGFKPNDLLTKPLLTLYDSNGVVIKVAHTQDTYQTTSFFDTTLRLAVFPVKPEFAAASTLVGGFQMMGHVDDGSLIQGRAYGDTVMIVNLPAGAYTVSMTPDSDALPISVSSGIVLLEIYDMQPSSGSRFINISTRGKIESGLRQMIVGATISGSGHKQLLVRGIGPSLKSFGVTTALDDTVLNVYNPSGSIIGTNDDWQNSTSVDQVALVTPAVGAFSLPVTSRDASTLLLMSPGGFTVGVTASNGQSGIGMAEIYEH